VAHFGRAIKETEGLADVHVFLNGGVEERNVDVELTQLKVAGGRDGEEETKAGHADDMENVSIESRPTRWLQPLATNRALKRETSPKVSDLTL
jgi:hypothetical protein